MEYRCEDLPQFGVVLVPPTAPEFAAMLGDIERRLAEPVAGSPPALPRDEDESTPTMILCNRSQVAIAAVDWTWAFEPESGRTTRGSVTTSGGGTSLLSPFGLDERTRKLFGYWHVILPGSKRAIRGNTMFGENTDVRPPREDELWKGGRIGAASGSRRPQGNVKTATLTIDGVFFVDGGFAGPDTLHCFAQVTAEADAYLRVGKIARDGHDHGLSAAAILARIEGVTGPDRGPTHGRGDAVEMSLQNLANRIAMMRRMLSEDRVVYAAMSWADADVPKFHRL